MCSSVRGSYKVRWSVCSAGTNVLEPVRSAVLMTEEVLALVHLASLAALALGRVGTVEEGYVLIADITEPRKEGV